MAELTTPSNVTGKGVITKIIPDDDMPVDKHGTRADILVDDGKPN